MTVPVTSTGRSSPRLRHRSCASCWWTIRVRGWPNSGGGGVPHVALEPVIIDKLGGSQSLLGLDDPLLSLEKWMRIIREDRDPRLAVCESLAGAGTELRSGVRSGG